MFSVLIHAASIHLWLCIGCISQMCCRWNYQATEANHWSNTCEKEIYDKEKAQPNSDEGHEAFLQAEGKALSVRSSWLDESTVGFSFLGLGHTCHMKPSPIIHWASDPSQANRKTTCSGTFGFVRFQSDFKLLVVQTLISMGSDI